MDHRQLAFSRDLDGATALVLVNSDKKPVPVPLADPALHRLTDTLTGEAAGAAPEVAAGSYRVFASR